MKRGLKIFLVSIFAVLFLTTFVSAFSFSNFFNEFAGKITGNSVTGKVVSVICSDSDSGEDPFNFGAVSNGQTKFSDYCAGEGASLLPFTEYELSAKPGVYSLSFWIKPNSYGNTAVASSSSAGGDANTWGFVFRSDGNVEVWTSDGTKGQQAVVANDWNSIGFPSTSWTHVVAVVDGSTISYYKNNKLVKILNQTVKNSGTSYGFSVGSLGEYKGFYLDGKIRAFRFFDYSLNSAKVNDLYGEAFLNQLFEYSCDPSNEKIIHAENINCPLGCREGACLPVEDQTNETEEEVNITCEDSDGGIDEFKVGIVNFTKGSSSYISKDICIDATNDYSDKEDYVRDYYCNKNGVSSSEILCSFGCENGACAEESNITEIESGEVYSLTLGETMFIGNIEVGVSYIGASSVKFVINGELTPAILENQEYQLTEGDYEITIFVTDILFSYGDNEYDYVVFSLSVDPVKTNLVSCSDVISFMKYPSNINYAGDSWELIDSNAYDSDKESKYYSSWKYQSEAINHYASLNIIDLEDQASVEKALNQSLRYQLCNKQNFYIKGAEEKSQTVYVCENFWRLSQQAQQVSPNDGWDYTEDIVVLWFNDNKLFSAEFSLNNYYYCIGEESCAQEIEWNQMRKQDDLISFVNNLISNQGKWVSPYMDYLSENFVKVFVSACPSQVSTEYYSGSWNCKQEPVICPPHGEQTQVCTRYDYDSGKEEVKTNTISCNPGICAGCMVPRWFESYSDNNCIEYGFRFKQQTAWDIKNVFVEDSQSEGVSVEEANAGGITLIIYPNDTAMLSFPVYGNENLTEVTYFLEQGKEYDWNLDYGFEGNISYTFYVNKISYSSSNYGNSFIDLTFNMQGYESQQVPAYMNMYCDIDGKIREQKITNGEECQNNFECYSNLCSSGECIGLKEVVNDIKGFNGLLAKIFCKISHLANEDAYLQCVTDSTAAK